MESKRCWFRRDCGWLLSFNRTSMESKRNHQGNRRNQFQLLIEPVWNRNMPKQKARRFTARQLLIEPVWNRNTAETPGDWTRTTFNRTSMESKHQGVGNMPYRPHTFNRTSMESKLIRIPCRSYALLYF